jgi:hypothetical protein
MILTASNFLVSSELRTSFVKLSSMGSKNVHVSLGSVRIEIDHVQFLFYNKCEYSLVIGENVFDLKKVFLVIFLL